MNVKRWSTLALYAIAMAWVESAVVYYLRVLIDRIDPYQVNPLPETVGLGQIELVRECATVVMIGAIGVLAGTNARTRFGYFIAAFGIWDIFYYVFLRVMTGWPQSVWDWDILFLIPLPWWGPVLAPVMIAAWMIVFGTLVSQSDLSPHHLACGACLVGILLAFYTFVADSIRAAPLGIDAIRNVLPSQFNWLLFLFAFALISAVVIDVVRMICTKRRTRLFSSVTITRFAEQFYH